MDGSIIGIDVGTSVIKTALFAIDGKMLHVTARDSQLIRTFDSWAECDMNDIWEKVAACLGELMANAPPHAHPIRGIGITAQGDGTWLIDRQKKAFRPAITWLDGRVAETVDALHDDGTADEVFTITGTDLNTSNQALQLRWLKEHEPETIRRTWKALRAKDWVFLNLTGVVTTDISDASFTYLDMQSGEYSTRVLELTGIADLDHLMPEVRSVPQNIATILDSVADATNIPRNTPIVCGPLDVSASAIGVGVHDIHDAVTVFGTAGIHQVVIDDPPGPPMGSGYTISHGHHDRWLRLLPTKTGTLNSQWFVEQFYGTEGYDAQGRIDWKRIEAELEVIPVGSRGILYHPYIDPSGERAPFNNPTARAQFTGIHLNHDRKTILHAVFEGVVLSALDCYSRFPFTAKEVRLTGGGANSTFWSQMFCDAIGSPVRHVLEKEAGCKGAMISAAIALGLYPSFEACLEKTIALGPEYRPDAKRHAQYLQLLDIFRETYQAMVPTWRKLYDFSRNMND
jgi:erythritol kinase